MGSLLLISVMAVIVQTPQSINSNSIFSAISLFLLSVFPFISFILKITQLHPCLMEATQIYCATAKAMRRLLVIIKEAHIEVQFILVCTGSLIFGLCNTPRIFKVSFLLAFVLKIFHHLSVSMVQRPWSPQECYFLVRKLDLLHLCFSLNFYFLMFLCNFPLCFSLLTYSQSFFSLSADYLRHSRQRRSKIQFN